MPTNILIQCKSQIIFTLLLKSIPYKRIQAKFQAIDARPSLLRQIHIYMETSSFDHGYKARSNGQNVDSLCFLYMSIKSNIFKQHIHKVIRWKKQMICFEPSRKFSSRFLNWSMCFYSNIYSQWAKIMNQI